MDAIMLRQWLMENGPVRTRVHGAQRRLFTHRTDDMLCIEGTNTKSCVLVRRAQYDEAVSAIIERSRKQQTKIDALRLARKKRCISRHPIQIPLLGEK
jgi:hypothetical protein